MARAEKHVLVVDDDPDYCATLVDLVSAEFPFAKVSQADSAESAMELVRAEPVDLLIVDYRLPHQDGIALVEAAKAILPKAKFLMLSAEPDQYLLIKAGSTVLSKPIEPEVLTRMVRQLLSPRPRAKSS